MSTKDTFDDSQPCAVDYCPNYACRFKADGKGYCIDHDPKEQFERIHSNVKRTEATLDMVQIPREVAERIAMDLRAVIYHQLFEKEDARRAAAIVGGEPIILESQSEAKKSREADLSALEAALNG